MSDEPIIPRLSRSQLSREEAISFGETERWRSMTPVDRGLFQLRQDRLCMPLALFQDELSALLARPVFTHELADPDALWSEHLRRVHTPIVLDIPKNAPGRLSSQGQSRCHRSDYGALHDSQAKRQGSKAASDTED